MRFLNLFMALIAVFCRTFNPADYAEPAQTDENYGGGNTWNNTGSMEQEEGASKLIYWERLPLPLCDLFTWDVKQEFSGLCLTS